MQKQFPAEFSALMAQYRDTAAGLGKDHPMSRRLWLIAMELAPSWFVDEMRAMAKQMGLLPEPFACDDNGQRFYALDDVAAKLGMSADEVAQHMAMLRADAEAVGLSDVLNSTDAADLHSLH